ncbi:class I SAM-dependent methyltransferase [Mucilaginibacter sp. X4EP1]|uniref:class I SAM-dependent methyltransferase n=1 Tax=Mucilaginibacter sp. X4EP1 TaxID=2723092 RepID=UPI0021694381|nr:class I SAM-dependent methyltransferase [Mucilaginibacter sp. X4EP1]MCS3814083.1 ubiquinone/menaquinone biosynthesis C-methylase UbiE [Mucilaginibacter sp. X4EP1]
MNVDVLDTEVGLQNPNVAFEKLYLKVRDHEKRGISDEQLQQLPDIDTSHIHYTEWQVRKRSSERLKTYLKKQKRPLNVLEIGCGNGWLCSKLADIPNTNVTGLDINITEIDQAKRVFKKLNLEFVASEFKPGLFKQNFDIILFAASLPYFKNLDEILNNSLISLADNGEIHILDTHFYESDGVNGAIERMENYYTAMGFPEMSACYYHYTLNDIQQFNPEILVNPRSFFNKIIKKEPFYWLTISN